MECAGDEYFPETLLSGTCPMLPATLWLLDTSAGPAAASTSDRPKRVQSGGKSLKAPAEGGKRGVRASAIPSPCTAARRPQKPSAGSKAAALRRPTAGGECGPARAERCPSPLDDASAEDEAWGIVAAHDARERLARSCSLLARSVQGSNCGTTSSSLPGSSPRSSATLDSVSSLRRVQREIAGHLAAGASSGSCDDLATKSADALPDALAPTGAGRCKPRPQNGSALPKQRGVASRAHVLARAADAANGGEKRVVKGGGKGRDRTVFESPSELGVAALRAPQSPDTESPVHPGTPAVPGADSVDVLCGNGPHDVDGSVMRHGVLVDLDSDHSATHTGDKNACQAMSPGPASSAQDASTAEVAAMSPAAFDDLVWMPLKRINTRLSVDVAGTGKLPECPQRRDGFVASRRAGASIDVAPPRHQSALSRSMPAWHDDAHQQSQGGVGPSAPPLPPPPPPPRGSVDEGGPGTASGSRPPKAGKSAVAPKYNPSDPRTFPWLAHLEEYQKERAKARSRGWLGGLLSTRKREPGV